MERIKGLSIWIVALFITMILFQNCSGFNALNPLTSETSDSNKVATPPSLTFSSQLIMTKNDVDQISIEALCSSDISEGTSLDWTLLDQNFVALAGASASCNGGMSGFSVQGLQAVSCGEEMTLQTSINGKNGPEQFEVKVIRECNFVRSTAIASPPTQQCFLEYKNSVDGTLCDNSCYADDGVLQSRLKAELKECAIGVPALDVANQRPLLFSDIDSLIFTPKCVTCHSVAGGLLGGVGLESFADSLGVVTPGDPAGSLLNFSVMNRRMPPLSPISDQEALLIQQWITEGALEVAP